jgi:hypothetical protein
LILIQEETLRVSDQRYVIPLRCCFAVDDTCVPAVRLSTNPDAGPNGDGSVDDIRGRNEQLMLCHVGDIDEREDQPVVSHPLAVPKAKVGT